MMGALRFKIGAGHGRRDMDWPIGVLIGVGLIVLLVLVFVVVTPMLRRHAGVAPGWRARCTKCGKTRDAGAAGMTRIGAASAGKIVLGWCRGCRFLRLVAIERKPESNVDQAESVTT